MEWILLWICLAGMAYPGYSQSVDDARALTTDLLANYSRIVRPKRNQSEAIEVKMGIELITIQDFDEVQETLSITAVLFLYWTDELMVWNPSEYGGIEEVKFESHQVWTPMLVLLNNVEKIQKMGFDDDWLMVTYHYNGTAAFYPGGVLSSKCDVDVTYFPWDRHKCTLQFTTWGFDVKQLYITPFRNEISRSFYSPNGAWDYVSSGFSITPIFTLGADLELERKPRFVVVNVIVPIVLLAILSAIVFYIPVESGERISYSITMLLAIAVFLTLVGDNLPKTSNPMSIFSYYLMSVLILDIFVTLANIFSLRIYYLDENIPVESCWLRFAQCFSCKKKKTNRKKEKAKVQHVATGVPNGISSPSVYINTRAYNPPVYHSDRKQWETRAHGEILYNGNRANFENKPKRLQNTDHDCVDTNITWKDVSLCVDKFCFVLMVLLIFTMTLVFFLVLWSGPKSDK